MLKALKKAPEERYASAEQLSEDLRRYLRGFPVEARPDTTTYRVRKFAQRHRSAAVAAGLFVAALIAGIVTTSWQAHRADVERSRAERHLNEVRELSSVYLADVYDAVAYLPGGTKARKLLVENSIKYLRGLERDAQDSPQLQRDLANAYDRLGDVQGDYIGANVGDTQGAIESYRRALNLRRGLVNRDPTIDARRELLRSCVKLSELLMGQSAVAEALPLAREGAELADTLLADKAATSRDRRYAAAAYMNFGWAQGLSTGEINPGMQADGEGARAARGNWLQKTQRTRMRSATSRSSRDASATCTAKVVDEPAKAMPYYERALSLIEPIAAAEPRRRRAAACQGIRAGLDRRPAERSATTSRRPGQLSARARHPRTLARSRSGRSAGTAGGRIHVERPRQQSPAAQRRRSGVARLQSRGNDRAQRAAAAADRHRRDSHAAGSHVREPRARHRRDVDINPRHRSTCVPTTCAKLATGRVVRWMLLQPSGWRCARRPARRSA